MLRATRCQAILRAALIVAASVLFILGPVALATAQGDGVISVQIVNGTADADPSSLADLEVSLHRFFGEESLGTVTDLSDDEGHVQFKGLPTAPNYSFGVIVRYQGVEYGSDLVSFSEGSTVAPLTVNVYETTESDQAIHVLRTHLIFDVVGQGLRVAEMYIIGNDSDRTFVGTQDGRTLEFTLPEGAMGLAFQDNRLQDSVIMTDEGFVDTLPVPPGSRQLLLSYALASEGETYRFARRIVYPTDNINVLVSDVGAVVDSDFLTHQEPVAAGEGQRYLHLAGQDLAPGTEFVITFDKLPRTVPTSGPGAARAVPRQGLDLSLLRWASVVLAVAAIGFAVLGYPILRRRRESDLGRQTAGLEQERDALIQAIARLDDQFEAGEIPEAEYQRRRARQKEKLIEVARRMRG